MGGNDPSFPERTGANCIRRDTPSGPSDGNVWDGRKMWYLLHVLCDE